MKNILEGMNSKLGGIEHLSYPEDRIMETTQWKEPIENQIKNENSLKDLWDNIKYISIHITGIPEGGERKKGVETAFNEIIAENIPSLKKKTDIQIQEHRGSQTRWTQRESQQDLSQLKW